MDWVPDDDDPWDYDERYEAASIADTAELAHRARYSGDDENMTVEEGSYRFVEAGTVVSFRSSVFSLPPRAPTPPTKMARVMSAIRAIRPRRPPRLGDVSEALRHARSRLTRSVSEGVWSIRRTLHDRPRALNLRTVFRRRAGPPPPLREVLTMTPRSSISSPRSIAECTACRVDLLEDDPDAIRVPCGHLYHSECLAMLVNAAVNTPSQFPPRCCRRTIPTNLFRRLLDADQRKAFDLLEEERSTIRPLYCANPRCSHFLGPRDKNVHACRDASCKTRTCARCLAAVETPPPPPGARQNQRHGCAGGADGQKSGDAARRAVLSLGTSLGWVRCPGCEQLVERNGGCPHMTCRCGTEFCYGCGRRYNACRCGRGAAPVALPQPGPPPFVITPPPRPPPQPMFLAPPQVREMPSVAAIPLCPPTPPPRMSLFEQPGFRAMVVHPLPDAPDVSEYFRVPPSGGQRETHGARSHETPHVHSRRPPTQEFEQGASSSAAARHPARRAPPPHSALPQNVDTEEENPSAPSRSSFSATRIELHPAPVVVHGLLGYLGWIVPGPQGPYDRQYWGSVRDSMYAPAPRHSPTGTGQPGDSGDTTGLATVSIPPAQPVGGSQATPSAPSRSSWSDAQFGDASARSEFESPASDPEDELATPTTPAVDPYELVRKLGELAQQSRARSRSPRRPVHTEDSSMALDRILVADS
ncbi:hypothetical protein C8Q77DRAFT_698630 [Trametes polyzona]|nr:hypothetical protein C8Q77DRAFT_698630 [Trametes polyzona]